MKLNKFAELLMELHHVSSSPVELSCIGPVHDSHLFRVEIDFINSIGVEQKVSGDAFIFEGDSTTDAFMPVLSSLLNKIKELQEP